MAHAYLVREQPFLACHTIAVEGEPNQSRHGQRRQEQAAAPAWEGIAVVEGNAGGADDRRPDLERVLHSRRRAQVGDDRAIEVQAVRHQWPAVVAAGADDVDLVAAAGPELRLPQAAGPGIEGKALRVAMAVGPDFGPGARVVEERIASRWAPIPLQPQHLAREIIKALCASRVGQAVAGREIDLA